MFTRPPATLIGDWMSHQDTGTRPCVCSRKYSMRLQRVAQNRHVGDCARREFAGFHPWCGKPVSLRATGRAAIRSPRRTRRPQCRCHTTVPDTPGRRSGNPSPGSVRRAASAGIASCRGMRREKLRPHGRVARRRRLLFCGEIRHNAGRPRRRTLHSAARSKSAGSIGVTGMAMTSDLV